MPVNSVLFLTVYPHIEEKEAKFGCTVPTRDICRLQKHTSQIE
jgi:hypothetical protein